MNTTARENLSGKHLVIFGCGYVGSEFARQALARGLHVTALTRNEAKAIVLRESGVESVVAELADPAWHERIPGNADFVLNCVSSGGAGLEGYRRSYVDGMKSILVWAKERGRAGTLVFTSSTSVYPQGDGACVDERASTSEAGERGKILLEAEAALRTPRDAWVRWFVLRLAGIYGPGRHALLEQVRTGEISGRGDHRLNLAHRDDICAAIWAALLAPLGVANEIFNVADDHATAKADVAAWLAARLGMAPPRFTDEPRVGRRPVTPDRIVANDKIKDTLGWRPGFPSYREGYESILGNH